ncbi:MAG TPA: hypothetical protein VES02_05445 [Dermatophilaceae bacterium]|nr:hypothetical protein [Dermatophilaceae bacterium]
MSKPAVSQQLGSAGNLTDVHPELLLEAAGPLLTATAQEHG